MVGTKSAALFASRMSNERSAGELRPLKTERAKPHAGQWVGARPGLHQSINPLIQIWLGVPSRILTGNLEVRTLLLCSLSYGDRLNAKMQIVECRIKSQRPTCIHARPD